MLTLTLTLILTLTQKLALTLPHEPDPGPDPNTTVLIKAACARWKQLAPPHVHVLMLFFTPSDAQVKTFVLRCFIT